MRVADRKGSTPAHGPEPPERTHDERDIYKTGRPRCVRGTHFALHDRGDFSSNPVAMSTTVVFSCGRSVRLSKVPPFRMRWASSTVRTDGTFLGRKPTVRLQDHSKPRLEGSGRQRRPGECWPRGPCRVRVTTIVRPNRGRCSNQLSDSRRLTTRPTMIIAGGAMPAAATFCGKSASVPETVRCRAVVPHWMVAAGVSADMPFSMSRLQIRGSDFTPM